MTIIFRIVFICVLFLNTYEIFGDIQKNEIDDVRGLDIKDTIEKFLKDLQANIPEVINIADQNFTIPNNKYIKGTFNISNVSCTGLKEFNATVSYRRFVPIPKAYILALENISLNLYYKSDITLVNSNFFSLFGQGNASISLKNLIFDGNLSVSILPINASTTADINLDNVLVNITGLLRDEKFSNELGNFLGKGLTKIFALSKNDLSTTLTKTLNYVIQELLTHKYNFTDVNSQNLMNKNKNLIYLFQEIYNSTIPFD